MRTGLAILFRIIDPLLAEDEAPGFALVLPS
jgi:hypothetical protein